MNKIRCETCGKKKIEEYIIKIETSEKDHLFCLNCLKRTYNQLKLVPSKPFEVEQLMETLKEALKSKGIYEQIN